MNCNVLYFNTRNSVSLFFQSFYQSALWYFCQQVALLNKLENWKRVMKSLRLEENPCLDSCTTMRGTSSSLSQRGPFTCWSGSIGRRNDGSRSLSSTYLLSTTLPVLFARSWNGDIWDVILLGQNGLISWEASRYICKTGIKVSIWSGSYPMFRPHWRASGYSLVLLIAINLFIEKINKQELSNSRNTSLHSSYCLHWLSG